MAKIIFGNHASVIVGVDEDLSFYEGAGAGPNVTKVKAAVARKA